MAASVGNAVGAIAGYSKWREGRKMQKKAQALIDNFEWEELKNPYKDLQVSTMGADLRREENARMGATAVDALQGGGTRAIVGGLGRLQAQNNLMNREIAANLDEQRKSIDYAAAQDDTRIRDMIEKRQSDELQGYGQMLNVGMGMKYGGAADMQASGQAQSEHNMNVMQMVMGMGGGGGMSDRRLKKNISKVGTSPKGLNIYNFEYKDPEKYGFGLFQGVMADEVPEEAKIEQPDGYFAVDYSKLDVEFLSITKIK